MKNNNLSFVDPHEHLDVETLNNELEPLGFVYKPDQDIFISRMYAWQRKYGYCRSFDEAAPLLSMIVDCEPIYFEYDNRKWLIEFWKGQYGMTTGGEIGIYVSNGINSNMSNDIDEIVYDSVTDKECIPLSYVLKKNGRTILVRSAKHWWLTGFKLGEFVEPSELIMNMEITLKNEDMCDAFVNGLRKSGYKDKEIRIINNSVYLTFDKPHTEQSVTKTPLISYVMQNNNRLYCELYNSLTKDYDNTLDKLNFLKDQFPDLYKYIMNIRGTRQSINIYKAKRII